MRAIWKYGRWILLALILGLIALTIARLPHAFDAQKSADAIAKIKAAHITMDDVDGKHLPPPPDPGDVDATVAGVDANQNGIRDDVELAIFKKYPNDAKLSSASSSS